MCTHLRSALATGVHCSEETPACDIRSVASALQMSSGELNGIGQIVWSLWSLLSFPHGHHLEYMPARLGRSWALRITTFSPKSKGGWEPNVVTVCLWQGGESLLNIPHLLLLKSQDFKTWALFSGQISLPDHCRLWGFVWPPFPKEPAGLCQNH